MFRKMTFLYNPGDGGAGSGAGGDEGGAGGNGNGSGGDKATFSDVQQKEVDRIVAERLKRAAGSETTALLKKLGVEKVEDLETSLGEYKTLKASQLSDLEKAQQAAKDAQAKVDAAEKAKADALAVAQQKLMRAAVTAEAVRQNFDESEISSVWLTLQQDKKLYESIKPKAESDDEFEGVDKAVGEIAKAHPKWLKTAAVSVDVNARNRNGSATSKEKLDEEREAELRARYNIKKK
jgi:hypothetical protein